MFRSCVRERMPEGGSEGRDAAGLDRIGAQSASDRREVRRSEPINLSTTARLLLAKTTQTAPTLYWAAVETSLPFIMKPPSPETETQTD